MNFEMVQDGANPTIIKVIGIGGGGCNAVDRMVEVGLEGVEFIAANTDLQDLQKKRSQGKIQLGPKLTGGYGAGMVPDVGEKAAMESRDEIKEMLRGTDLLFITAGEGGGTGTGASPVIAQIAKELSILTIGVVTRPFLFEGKPRMRLAEEGIQNLMEHVDSLIVIKNENLLKISNKQTTILNAYELANNVLKNAVQGISELLTRPGLINLDFADLKTVMSKKGKAVMSFGIATGDNRSMDVVESALSSPLLEEDSISGATGLLINVTGGKDLNMGEVDQIVKAVIREADENANIIFGHTFDNTITDEVRLTIVATGFITMKAKTASENETYSPKLEILAGKEFEKPAFQRVMKSNFVNTQMGNDDKIVKELKQQDSYNNEPQFLINWDEENYDIPAFLRNKTKTL
ncbi:MAG: cell division protein FtsZ [bacterium]|nr:cell division protein FtsZ [bacterium]